MLTYLKKVMAKDKFNFILQIQLDQKEFRKIIMKNRGLKKKLLLQAIFYAYQK